MSRALPWYKHCPRDFAAETRGWPLIAKAIYRELLDAAWDMEHGLPPSIEELRRLTGATAREWAVGWPHFDHKFPVGGDGRRRSPLLERERGRATEVARKRSSMASAAAHARWGSRSTGPVRVFGDAEGSADGTALGSAEGSADGMPSTSTSTSTSNIPDSGERPSRKRARPASPEGPRARPGAVLDEGSEAVKRNRALAAAVAAKGAA